MKARFLIPILLIVFLVTALLGIKYTIDQVRKIPSNLVDSTHRTTEQILQAASQVFENILQIKPEITVDQKVVQVQTSPIAEFAVMQREFKLTYQWHHKWLGSTKAMNLTSNFVAKSGFDLSEPFQMEFDPHTQKLHATLPQAKILSIEQVGELAADGTHGLINKLNEKDRSLALNAFLKQAKTHIEASELNDLAQKEIINKLQNLSEAQELSITFIVQQPEAIDKGFPEFELSTEDNNE